MEDKEKTAVSFVDFEAYAPAKGQPGAFLAYKISGFRRPIGVVVLQLSIDKLNAIMTNNQRWHEIGLGRSGETYLVSSEGSLRSDSRFFIEDKEGYLASLAATGLSGLLVDKINIRGTGIGLHRIETLSVEKALKGESGINTITGYRGAEVISAYAILQVEGTDWAIISEVDTAEALGASDQRGLFDDWVSTYDHDLIDDLGYVADAEACRLFESLVPDQQVRILDAGCGTGLVGRRLRAAGYTDIHGNDYAEKMLDQARATNAYQTLKQHDLTQPIKTDQPFDAAIAVGVFGFNLPSAEHLVNITACLKVGGVAVVTVNGKAWQEVDWKSKLENFDENYPGTRLLQVQTIDYLKSDGIDGRLLTLERC